MNVLLVDDQELIVNSLKDGMEWNELGVAEVFTATNSYEAKFILMNYRVDLLITDIEMPEEDGIALAEWALKLCEDIIIVFLTSHPSFQYAKEGVRLHVFDYVLQPVLFSELSEVVIRAGKRVRELQANRESWESSHFVRQHRNAVFDSLVLKSLNSREDDVWKTWHSVEEMYREKHGGLAEYLLLLVVGQWELVQKKWEDDLIRTAIANVLTEEFEEHGAEVGIANIEEGNYWAFLFIKEPFSTAEEYRGKIEAFTERVNGIGAFKVSGFGNDMPVKNLGPALRGLKKRMLKGAKSGKVTWEDSADAEDLGYNAAAQSIEYIHKHIGQKISRQEVAEYVHLNPEYFSKLFHKETGLSFKDFVLNEKMKCAAELLSSSRLPVGIIATKIGFDNFSHFSQTFRRHYELSPQEYRQKYGI